MPDQTPQLANLYIEALLLLSKLDEGRRSRWLPRVRHKLDTARRRGTLAGSTG